MPERFVGAATMTTNPLLPARARTAAAARRQRAEPDRCRPGPAHPADEPNRLPHQLTPPTGGAGRPRSCAVPPPCRDDRDRRPRRGRDRPGRRHPRLPGMHPPAAPLGSRPHPHRARPRPHHAGPAAAAGPLPHLPGHPRAAARRGHGAPGRHHRGHRLGVAGQRPRDRLPADRRPARPAAVHGAALDPRGPRSRPPRVAPHAGHGLAGPGRPRCDQHPRAAGHASLPRRPCATGSRLIRSPTRTGG